MLHQAPSIYQSPKCFVTYGMMGHVDPRQIPSRGKPWTAISDLDFIHKVDLIIPQDIYEAVAQKMTEREAPAYYRVVMTLGQVLETKFLTQYIKLGNIMMLSEGKTTIGNLFTLREGNLDLYLDRETYERAGLEGKPYGIKGGRGSKPRWTMSVDLLQDLNAKQMTSSPRPSTDTGIHQIPLRIPSTILAQGDREALEYSATDMYEWLSLVRLESPRVVAGDAIDSYLSRYAPPGADSTADQVQVFTNCPSQSWFALSGTTFSRNILGGCNELSFLRPPESSGEFLMWETKSQD
ncbi:uncharacterized protein Triagg1_3247 [Trichoderma aggressivum f. europaeum]|uniref:Uncharacterized protein n=1 Tax=Trichoderma aggressivum f. europaeum TaxID=173218 RepID=A0AAE1IFQ2_9HYPO|nr:hypothetical protein Triagg1_3247 [Trichoderma aggressivum f. europaeum]